MASKISGPSIANLEKSLQMNHADAVLLKGLMDGTVNSEKLADEMGLLKGFHNLPSRAERIMMIANKLTNSSGVEYVPDRDDTYTSAYGLEYLNQGDTYDTTLIYDKGKGRFFISSWGDEVERHPRRFGE